MSVVKLPLAVKWVFSSKVLGGVCRSASAALLMYEFTRIHDEILSRYLVAVMCFDDLL